MLGCNKRYIDLSFLRKYVRIYGYYFNGENESKILKLKFLD